MREFPLAPGPEVEALAPGAMAKGRADRFNLQYTLLQICNCFALRRVDPVCRVDSESRGKAEAHR